MDDGDLWLRWMWTSVLRHAGEWISGSSWKINTKELDLLLHINTASSSRNDDALSILCFQPYGSTNLQRHTQEKESY